MHLKNTAARALGLFVLAPLALAGCSSGGDQSGGGAQSGALEVHLMMAAGSPQEKVMQDLVKKFEQQEGVKINFTTDYKNYEEDLKVKMASDTLPDVISTHGWSVLRYSPFLMPLEDRSWAQYLNPGLEEVMHDEEGHMYALPLEYGLTGITVNYDVVEKAGADSETLTTWEGFEDALSKVRSTLDITPMAVSAKETVGSTPNYIASGQFTVDELEKFKTGEFVTDAWQREITDRIEKWAESEYFNPDYVSATMDDLARQLADGSTAFSMAWPSLVTTAKEYNPDANLGFIPLPSPDGPYMVGGEGVASFGVAKNSKNSEMALKFLDFLAEPENAQEILAALGAYSGLTNVDVDLGDLQPSYDTWVANGSVPTKPFFDRMYLPNGIWATVKSTTDGQINQQITASDAAKQMQEEYDTLFGQQ